VTGIGRVAARVAWWAFVVAVVTSPFGARLVLVERRLGVISVYGDLGIQPVDVAVLVTLAMWAIAIALDPGRRPIRTAPRPLALAIAGLVILGWLAVPGALDPGLAAEGAARLTLAVALGLYVRNEVADLRRLVAPATAMLGLEAVVALGQAGVQHDLGLQVLGERMLDPRLSGISVVVAEDGTRWLRAYGLSGHPNILGGAIAFGLLTVAAGIAGGWGRFVRPLERVAAGLGLALGAAALVASFSRSAWLGLAAGVVAGSVGLVATGDRPALRRWLIALMPVVVVSAVVLLAVQPVLATRLAVEDQVATEARSIDERVALIGATLGILRDHLVLGTGIGGLPLAMHWAEPDFAFFVAPAHLVILTIAAETGVLGGLCALVVLVAPWWWMARRWRRLTVASAGAAALVAATTVVGLFDHYPWTFSAGRLWLVIGLGVGAAAAGAVADGAGDADPGDAP
jgi:O-antigen ligase